MMTVISPVSRCSRMARMLAIAGVLTISSPLSGLARSPQIDELAASPPAAVVAGHGVQLSDMDLSVDPGQDFYRYATGAWQDGNEIPPDEAWWGVYDQTNDLTRNQLIDVLAQYAASDTLPVGSDEWKAVQLFAQARDMDTRNAQGLDPIAGDLAQIDEIASLDRPDSTTASVSCRAESSSTLLKTANAARRRNAVATFAMCAPIGAFFSRSRRPVSIVPTHESRPTATPAPQGRPIDCPTARPFSRVTRMRERGRLVYLKDD